MKIQMFKMDTLQRCPSGYSYLYYLMARVEAYEDH